MRRPALALAAALALAPALAPAAARAQFPGLSLTFTEPNGVVGPADAIEVRVRLALDAAAPAPLTFRGYTDPPPYGLPPALIPTEGYIYPAGALAPFATYDFAATGLAYGCVGDTFWASCGGGPYDFIWWTDRTDPTRPVVPGPYDVTLLPGQSVDYLFGTYTPRGGGAAPGTYRFTDAPFEIAITGTDAAGDRIDGYALLARTCESNDPACAFTRTVVASTAPEPAGLALVATGAAAMAWTLRRRRAA